ncbi:gamma-glutamylcyclotransferase [Chitinibacter fontanus]|uniref:Gamma-glutamylcyclotransferase family protein n=1 Tax=Chitinibacter fontanus TaxID=1737446 RepID=A0A7D5VBK2_9NEIS|nr:gamma-glutamylcyclotransferase family protein [Chitinibacter fontanus]QLI83077.1 gamma-glutamylcyclotransferase [Chitinibacter fontanus]
MTNADYLFVYGTLKRGFCNHHWLGGARYISAAKTVKDFALYTIEYPFLCHTPALYPVFGEVYQISASELARADELEQHPDDYCREVIEVLLEDGTPLMAWAYFHPRPQGRLLTEGVFTAGA